jgi:hypothetical protein
MNRNLDFIQLNNFANLHDGDKVWFCKTDFLQEDFGQISLLDHDVILITGNSDYPITDHILDLAPKNITKWFCQNAVSKNPIIEPIPIGIENRDECIRNGHGVGWGNRVQEKMDCLNYMQPESISEFIYCNFNIKTNTEHRNKVWNIASNCSHIVCESPTLSIKEWVSEVKKYKMNLCPAGNGVDTHRLWETLYAGRIPITVKIGDYKIYEMYEKLPIIIINDIDELRDKQHMEDLYNITIGKTYQLSITSQSYWINRIKKAAQETET